MKRKDVNSKECILSEDFDEDQGNSEHHKEADRGRQNQTSITTLLNPILCHQQSVYLPLRNYFVSKPFKASLSQESWFQYKTIGSSADERLL
jgi:hypothetical protein